MAAVNGHEVRHLDTQLKYVRWMKNGPKIDVNRASVRKNGQR